MVPMADDLKDLLEHPVAKAAFRVFGEALHAGVKSFADSLLEKGQAATEEANVRIKRARARVRGIGVEEADRRQ
jgi:hypothetical protein